LEFLQENQAHKIMIKYILHMSYFGSKFPEGINSDYVEIPGVENVTCPLFRRVVNKSLSAKDTTYFNCDGCNTKDALIVYIDLETERFFVRQDSKCTNPPPDSK
jgi:hypothetical protein